MKIQRRLWELTKCKISGNNVSVQKSLAFKKLNKFSKMSFTTKFKLQVPSLAQALQGWAGNQWVIYICNIVLFSLRRDPRIIEISKLLKSGSYWLEHRQEKSNKNVWVNVCIENCKPLTKTWKKNEIKSLSCSGGAASVPAGRHGGRSGEQEPAAETHEGLLLLRVVFSASEMPSPFSFPLH